MKNKNIIFIHMPKAGGTTLHEIIEREYWYMRENTYTVQRFRHLPDFLSMPQEEKNKIKLLKGHIPYGLHEHLKGESVYFTMLRNPLNRIFSAYHYIISKPKHDRYDFIKSKGINFSQFVELNVNPWIWNAQTKILAGETDLSKECSENVYKRALYNVEKNFIAIGFLEFFDQSVLHFGRSLGWTKLPLYKKSNITIHAKAKPTIVDDKTRNIIKRKNKFDEMLYKKLFEKEKDGLFQRNISYSISKIANSIYRIIK